MTVKNYLLNFATFLDSSRFVEIDDGHEHFALFDAGVEGRITRDGALMELWKNYGQRGMATMLTVGVHTDMPLVRFREE